MFSIVKGCPRPSVRFVRLAGGVTHCNNAALHYHFGSKEELISQLMVDGAAVLDQRQRELPRHASIVRSLSRMPQWAVSTCSFVSIRFRAACKSYPIWQGRPA